MDYFPLWLMASSLTVLIVYMYFEKRGIYLSIDSIILMSVLSFFMWPMFLSAVITIYLLRKGK